MITIKHAQVNNIHVHDFQLPEDPFLLFYGPSGSGKTTLAIDILLSESRRRYLENLRLQFGGTTGSNVPSQISNLPVVTALEQSRDQTRGMFETLEVCTQLQSSLRLIFLRFGDVFCRIHQRKIERYEPQKILTNMSFVEGEKVVVLAPLETTQDIDFLSFTEELIRNGYVRVYVEGIGVCKLEDVKQIPEKWYLVIDRLKWKASSNKRFLDSVELAYAIGKNTVGILRETITLFSRHFFDALGPIPPITPEMLLSKSASGACDICVGTGYLKQNVCSQCCGTGLTVIARFFGFDNCNLQKCLTTPLHALSSLLRKLQIHDPHMEFVLQRIETLCSWNLGHLTLAHKYDHLSTGEKSLLGTCMTMCNDFEQCLFVIDEPSLGLDKESLLLLLQNIKKHLSTKKRCIIIDHDPICKSHVDRILYFGPKSGTEGGQISTKPFAEESIFEIGWSSSSLEEITDIPHSIQYAKHGMTLLWGKTGSGKTTMLRNIYEQLQKSGNCRVQWIAATEIQASARSCVASYCGILSEIRIIFSQLTLSKMKGYDASYFSFNQKRGQCQKCLGIGEIITSIPPLPKLREVCSMCNGKRYKESVLEVRFKGYSIADVLQLEVRQAIVLFSSIPQLYRPLQILQSIGLGYLSLGQNSHSLSGGEARRVRIAMELMKIHTQQSSDIICIDQPLAGLHHDDQLFLFDVFREIMNRGCSLFVASHNKILYDNAHHILSVPL